MKDSEAKPEQTPTPETILRSVFEDELSDLAAIADRIVSASRQPGGNVRQRRLRTILEEVASG